MPTLGNSFLSGSSSESNLSIDISQMSNGFKNVLNDWAISNGGMCFIADDDQEKINIGFNNCIGPKVLVVFIGEEPYGDEQIAELVGYVKRTWDVVIERGKILSDPRNSGLTTVTRNSRPFYSLVEEARDIVRNTSFPQPMVYSPNIYNGMRPMSSENWLMDSYVISISVLCQIARAQYQDPEISGNGPFTNLNDPPEFIGNAPFPSNFI